MRDRPNGPDLLELIRRIEAGDTGVEVPGDERYRGLLLASATAIAERQEEMGDAPEQAEQDRLREILGHDGRLEALNRDLARAIRDGAFDGENAAVREHLWQTALDRVRESNPKALKNQS